MISAVDILKAKILIVDDAEDAITTLQWLLENAGYSAVHATCDPHSVRALHAEHDFDLILLDLQMPGMDGFQVMESLKEFERDGYLPVLAITSEPDHKVRALRRGARDFLSKPVEVDELLVRVRNMIEVRLLYRERDSGTLSRDTGAA
ncbi:MAG: response regulator [Gammaproteobacteria bacterium]|nr:response regulator [Gammaproteobacteria bacterium]